MKFLLLKSTDPFIQHSFSISCKFYPRFLLGTVRFCHWKPEGTPGAVWVVCSMLRKVSQRFLRNLHAADRLRSVRNGTLFLIFQYAHCSSAIFELHSKDLDHVVLLFFRCLFPRSCFASRLTRLSNALRAAIEAARKASSSVQVSAFASDLDRLRAIDTGSNC